MKDYKILAEICNDIIGDCKPCKPQENALKEIINAIESGKLGDVSEQEMIENLKCVIADLTEQCNELQNENAALRERLGKSVELPSGNRVFFITEDEEGHESYIISKPTDCLTVDELYEIGKKYFTTREAAEARLAKLKGEKE